MVQKNLCKWSDYSLLSVVLCLHIKLCTSGIVALYVYYIAICVSKVSKMKCSALSVPPNGKWWWAEGTVLFRAWQCSHPHWQVSFMGGVCRGTFVGCRFFPGLPSKRRKGNGHKLEHRKFHLNITKICKGDWTLEHIPWRGCVVSVFRDIQTPAGHGLG